MEILIKELSPFGPRSPCKEHIDDVRMLGYHDPVSQFEEYRNIIPVGQKVSGLNFGHF